MLRILTPLAALVILALALSPQCAAQSSNSTGWQIKPVTLATSSAVDVCTLTGGPPCGKDVWVCWADAGTNGTATTITFTDSQTVPVSRPDHVAIAANSFYSPIINASPAGSCAYFPGGLKIQAGNANALTVFLSGKY